MSLENRYQCLHFQLDSDAAADEECLNLKKTKIFKYTRDFLLSLSALDACKKLPSDFDTSILCEFEDGVNSLPSGCSKGLCGRWEPSSWGLNEKDGPGRHFSNQNQLLWKNSEHDGLLGSGGYPRVPGHTHLTSVVALQGNGHKIHAPYHPPKCSPPNKAVTKWGGENKDSFNDETFGSVECLSEQRAEEEARRRALFELVRKEQHKPNKEKLTHIGDGHKESCDFWATRVQDVNCSNRSVQDCDKAKDNLEPQVLNSEPANSLATQSPALRPLLPPGFTSNTVEKNLGAKSLHCASQVEVKNSASLYLAPSINLNKGSSQDQFFGSGLPNSTSKEDSCDSGNHIVLNKGPGLGSMEKIKTVQESVHMETVTRFTEDVLDSPVIESRTVSPVVDEGMGAFYGEEIGFDGICKNHSQSGEVDAMIGSDFQISQKMKLGSINQFDEKEDLGAELFLPEEESLITYDDPIIPIQSSTFISDRNSLRNGLSASNIPVHVANELSPSNYSFTEERSSGSCFDDPLFLHESYSPMCRETQYHKLHTCESNSPIHQTDLNSRRPYFQSVSSNHSRMISQVKTMDQRSYQSNLFSDDDFNGIMQPAPRHTHAARRGYDHSVHQALVQQMHMPGDYPSHQLNRLSQNIHVPHPINEMACYAEGLSPVERFQLSHQQLGYAGAGMANHDPGGVFANNNRLALDRLIDAERRELHMNRLELAFRDQVSYGSRWTQMYENRSLW